MNFGPRSASRSFKMAALGLSLSLFSTAAVVAMAQQRPNEFHGVLSDAAVSEPGTGSTVRFAEVSAVNDARIATSSLVSSTSEKLTVAGAPGHHRVPVVTDWSTKHVVFAKPRTEAAAARLEHNTRYKMQTYRRNAPMVRKVADAKIDSSDLLNRFRNRVRVPHSVPSKGDPVHRDWSVNLNGSVAGLTPTPTVGASQFPAKFTFDVNAPPSCTTDYVVFNTNTSMLIAFNNLYSGTTTLGAANGTCTATDGTTLLAAPTVLWAYNVATTVDGDGITSTSVSLSEDGSTIMFVESSQLDGSVLHILKPRAGDGVAGDGTAAPIPVPTVATTLNWAGCTACMWNIPFTEDPAGFDHPSAGGGPVFAPDSNSAPFYDFDTDTLYVGDDAAYLHVFTNVLNGGATPPSEITGANFPIYTNNAGVLLGGVFPALTGPIYDSNSGRVFVADQYGDVDFIETGNGTVTNGPCVNQTGPPFTYPCLSSGGNYFAATNGIPDPPVVDSSLGTVLVFAGGGGGVGDDAFVAQALTTGTCVCGTGETGGGDFTFVNFGPVSGGGSGEPMHSGDFDDNYYNSSPGSVTGFMYVCAIDPDGATGGGNTALRQLSFNSTTGLVSSASALFIPVAYHPYDLCSPVTEVYNPNGNGGLGQDLMFFSVETGSVACNIETLPAVGYGAAAPAGGCVMSVDVTNTTDFPLIFPAAFAAEFPEDGGTSGIIVDNISPEAQASSIYFTPLGYVDSPGNCTYVGCAVKLTQNGLQ